MNGKKVKVNAIRMILEFGAALDNSSGIQKILDDEGNIVVPLDRFSDFCHDIGIILARVILNSAELSE